MTNEETVNVTFEEFLSSALQKNDENLRMTAPGSEEYERLTKERDMLAKLWLEYMGRPSFWDKFLNSGEKVVNVVCKILGTVAGIAIPVGMIKLGNRSGFLSADEIKSLDKMERFLSTK